MTVIGSGDCPPDLCPVSRGFLTDIPSMGGSLFLLAAFAFLVPVNVLTGLRWKTPLYSAALVVGLLFEVMGYVGRFMLGSNLASRKYFLIYLLGTVMGPTFITAAIYLVLPHILTIYGSDISCISQPIFLAYFFLAFDVFTLAFQGVGGGFAVQGTSDVEVNQGLNILLVGLALQALSIFVFLGFYYWFLIRLVHSRELLDQEHSDIYLSARFKTSLLCIQIAAILILIRTITRLVQVATGFDSAISQSQVYILVLDGAEVLLACILLTALPPGAAFRSAWAATSPSHHHNHHRRSIQHGGYSLQPQRSPVLIMSPPPGKTTTQRSSMQSMHSSRKQASPRWASHRRQPSAQRIEGQPPPPYERPISFQRMPYQPSPGRYTPGMESDSVSSSPAAIDSPRRVRRASRATADSLVEHDTIW